MTILDAFRIDGRVAVVSGAGKGIGRAIAIGLAEAGADVAIGARTAADLEAVAEQIRARGRRALTVPTDATSMAALEALADQTTAELGSIDIWVSNAGGIPDGTPRYLTRTTEDSWDAQIDLNLKAVWMGAVVAAKHMKEKGGVIVNTSSRAADGPQVKNGPYGAAKAAVNSLTATLSRELPPVSASMQSHQDRSRPTTSTSAWAPTTTTNASDCVR